MTGQSVGSDASPLSCFLFRPRKSRKSAGNAVIPTFPTHWSHGLQHLRHKRRNVRFKGLRRVHHATPAPNRAHSGSHAETRGVLSGGAITTLGLFHTFRKLCTAGCQNGVLCRFWALVGCVPEERGEPAEQRCAHARRCPEASRPRWAALSLPVLVLHRRASGVCHRCDKGQRTLLAGLLSFCLRCRGFFFGWYKISIAPEAQMKPRRLCLFLL